MRVITLTKDKKVGVVEFFQITIDSGDLPLVEFRDVPRELTEEVLNVIMHYFGGKR